MAAMVRFVDGKPVLLAAHDVRSLTDDPAAARAHRVTVSVPIALATLLQMRRERVPRLTPVVALSEIFREEPKLREAYRQTGGYITGATPNDVADALEATGAPLAQPTATDRFMALVREEQHENPRLSVMAAAGIVAGKERALYEDVRRESTTTLSGKPLATTPAAHVEKVKPVSALISSEPAAQRTIERLIAEERQRTNVSWSEALNRVVKANPTLWTAYVNQGGGPIDGVAAEDLFRQAADSGSD